MPQLPISVQARDGSGRFGAYLAVPKSGKGKNGLRQYDIASGERGGRAAYLEHNLALLCGADAATVVNNCAAALVLILRHFTTEMLCGVFPTGMPASGVLLFLGRNHAAKKLFTNLPFCRVRLDVICLNTSCNRRSCR